MSYLSSSTKWLSELEGEEYNMIHSYHMNSSFFEDHTLPQSFPSINYTTNYNDSSYVVIEEKPLKILKTLHTSPQLPSPPLPRKLQPSTQILSFENGGSNMNMNSPYNYPKGEDEGRKIKRDHHPVISGKGIKRAHLLDRSHSQVQEHIIAERKRRAKLTQRFVALSAVVPGLKKMDKASVLGDACKYIKHLQERVKEFEDQKKEMSVESMVLFKKSQFILDDESSSFSHGKSDSSDTVLPEIEVRVSCKDVMIKMIVEKQKFCVTKVLAEIEKLQLFIINTNVLPFGATLDITVIAQKERGFDMAFPGMAKKLRLALLEIM